MPALFAFFSIASFVLCVYGTAYRPAGTFYLLPTRAWELFAGCLLAMGWFPRLTHRKTLREALSILGLGFILTPFFLYTSDTSFPGVAAVPAVLGATLIIGTGAEKTTYVGRALSNGWLAYIGLISYSLYLWHWPIFAFARYVSIAELSIGTRVTLCVASIVAGALSMHLVEKPFRERRLAASRRGIVTLAMTTMFCLCGAGVAARIAEGVPLRLSEQQQAYQTSAMSDSRWSRALDIEDLPSSLLKFGLDSENVQVLVWGDSHARAMLPAIDKACVQYGLTGVGAIRSANPPALNMAGKSHLGGNEKAIPFNKKVVELLKQKPFQAVFMVAYWDIYLDDPEFAEKFCQTIREVTDLGIQVYVVSDVPRYSFEVPRFVITYSGLGLPIDLLGKTKTEHLRDSQGFAELAPEIEKAGGQILEPADHLLTSEDGHSYLPASSKDCLYSDSHHLSAAGAILLLPLFEQALQSHALASDNSAGLQE